MTLMRSVVVQAQFQWDGASWTDESDYFVTAKGSLEYLPPNEAYQSNKAVIQQMTVTLANTNWRFSEDNPSGPLYPYRNTGGVYHRKCRVLCTIDTRPTQTIFIGYIKGTQEDVKRNQMTFTVWDVGEILRQKLSTTMLKGLLEHEVVANFLTLAGLQDGNDFISPAYAASHGVTATLDYSADPIDYAWLDDEPVFDELVDVAQAAGARLYVTKEGMVRFEKGWQWTRPATVETVSQETYQDFAPEVDDKAFYDEVQVAYTSRSPGNSQDEIWKLDQSRSIYPGKTETINARFNYPAVDVVVPQPNVHYFLRTPSGQDMTGSVTVNIQIYAQQAIFTITNTSNSLVIFSQGRITGVPLVGRPAEQVKKKFGTTPYNRRLEVRDNPYVQTKMQAEAIATFLAWWYSVVKKSYTIKGLRGDPNRGLGTRLLIYGDTNRTYPGIVIKVDWRINVVNNAFAYLQDVKLVQNVFSTDYFVIGVDSLGGPKKVWH